MFMIFLVLAFKIGNTTDATETDTTKMVSTNTIKNNLIEKATVEYQSVLGYFLALPEIQLLIITR